MNIIKAKDFKPVNLSVLLYGSPGMGKTTTLGHLKSRTLIRCVPALGDSTALTASSSIGAEGFEHSQLTFSSPLGNVTFSKATHGRLPKTGFKREFCMCEEIIPQNNSSSGANIV